ncbi:MAG: anhydro-N-acetylmuramic acid kinase [Halioglobus sp.]
MGTTGAFFVGLMSGTSVDAIDSALLQCTATDAKILATHEHPIPIALKRQIAALSHSGSDEIERLGVLDRELGILFAEATLALLAIAKVQPRNVEAIGSHGQTIRHRPPSNAATKSASFSLQVGDPNTIAERTGITTVADFRRRDIAAGGEGAPLAPAFHAAAFGRAGVNRAVVNIGGIANVTMLEGCELRAGFDTGPGNTLLDHWIAQHHGEQFDRDGAWSATGRVHRPLLESLLTDSYFHREGPRSTGKEGFNLAWLASHLSAFNGLPTRDVQATLLQLTCSTITDAIARYPLTVSEIYVCGGGSHNTHLMNTLRAMVSPATLTTTTALGIEPDWVEAATFAWLASRTLKGLAGNCPAVTGAIGGRILGGIYPGANCNFTSDNENN